MQSPLLLPVASLAELNDIQRSAPVGADLITSGSCCEYLLPSGAVGVSLSQSKIVLAQPFRWFQIQSVRLPYGCRQNECFSAHYRA